MVSFYVDTGGELGSLTGFFYEDPDVYRRRVRESPKGERHRLYHANSDDFIGSSTIRNISCGEPNAGQHASKLQVEFPGRISWSANTMRRLLRLKAGNKDLSLSDIFKKQLNEDFGEIIVEGELVSFKVHRIVPMSTIQNYWTRVSNHFCWGSLFGNVATLYEAIDAIFYPRNAILIPEYWEYIDDEQDESDVA